MPPHLKVLKFVLGAMMWSRTLRQRRVVVVDGGKEMDKAPSNPRASSEWYLVRAHGPGLYIYPLPNGLVPHSCARACTVASEVPTEAQSFADCKLHIRTRLLASAFSNFWKTLLPVTTLRFEGSFKYTRLVLLGCLQSIYLVPQPPSCRVILQNLSDTCSRRQYGFHHDFWISVFWQVKAC